MPPVTWTISTTDFVGMQYDELRGKFLRELHRNTGKLKALHNELMIARTPEERTAIKAAALEVFNDFPDPSDPRYNNAEFLSKPDEEIGP